jgi:hypothetical protein
MATVTVCQLAPPAQSTLKRIAGTRASRARVRASLCAALLASWLAERRSAKASAFDLSSIKDTVGLIGRAGKLGKAIITINDLTPGKGAAAEYKEAVGLIGEFGVKIATNFICHRKAFVTATGKGAGVTEITPKDAAAAEIKALWDEIQAPLRREIAEQGATNVLRQLFPQQPIRVR